MQSSCLLGAQATVWGGRVVQPQVFETPAGGGILLGFASAKLGKFIGARGPRVSFWPGAAPCAILSYLNSLKTMPYFLACPPLRPSLRNSWHATSHTLVSKVGLLTLVWV